MDNNLLLQEFTDKASKTRIRSNSIAQKLVNFLHAEIATGKKVIAVNAKDVDSDKIHIQTVYNALRKNGVDVKRGVSFVVDSIDAHYVNRLLVKIA